MQENHQKSPQNREQISISVIVPLAPGGEDLSVLLADLKILPSCSEVLFMTADPECYCRKTSVIPGVPVRFLSTLGGRAESMNAGAEEARGNHLLFLHADSHLTEESFAALLRKIEQEPEALLYFDLKFDTGSSPLMHLNEKGAFFRSRILRTPFGDQGFCVSGDIFNGLGGYRVDVPYGEDHLLVRKARQEGISVISVKAPLYTSARKYQKNGWLRTTVTHLLLWRLQAYKDRENKRKKGLRTNEDGNRSFG